MPRFKFVKHFDIKTPDAYVLRSKIEEWVESRFCYLEDVHRNYLDCPVEEKAKRRTAWSSYSNNYSLLGHVVRFLCEVGLMSECVGKEYADKLYSMLIEDIEDRREEGKEE